MESYSYNSLNSPFLILLILPNFCIESSSYIYYNFGTAQSACLHFVLLIWQRVALYEHNKNST